MAHILHQTNPSDPLDIVRAARPLLGVDGVQVADGHVEVNQGLAYIVSRPLEHLLQDRPDAVEALGVGMLRPLLRALSAPSLLG